MNKARRIVVAGLGAMTPALVVTDPAQARTGEVIAAIEHGQSTAVTTLDREALKNALLELSPAEKLRIAGDRIRLAKSNAPSTRKAVGATVCVTTCCIVTKNCGGSGQRPPRQAR